MVIAVRKAAPTMSGAEPQPVEPVDESVRAEIIATVRAFVQRDVIPVAPDLERTDTFPTDIVATMRDLGLFGITIPEAYGGLGLDLLTYIGVIEELSYGWMSLTGIVNTHTMAATLVMTHGSEEQKRRWLPSMATGERRGCLSLSEPDAGSDTRNLSCRAQRDGEEYVLNGTKAWVTNGERAALVALAARSEEGISAFIVEKEPGPRFEGISVSKNVSKLGYRGVETVEMAYSDHRIPGRQPRRRGGPWSAPDPVCARDRSHQHCGARRRRGARGLRRRLAVRDRARDLRQGDRRAPGHSAQAGRHGDATRGGAPPHQERRGAQGGGLAL